MITDPLPLTDALASREVRSLLPTSLSSAEISKIRTDIVERAVISARTENAGYLQTIDDAVGQMLDGNLDQASARQILREKLSSIGYAPSAEDRFTIKDLSSDQRLNLVLATNTKMAQGYGAFAQANDPAVLDAVPAWELYRNQGRAEPRQWQRIWQEAGGTLYEGGRMIALKSDVIWSNISDFGQPYPPFKFNSGMWVRGVRRAEAERLGLIAPGQRPVQRDRGFNDDLQFTPQVRSQALMQALLEDLPGAIIDAVGVLRLAA